MPITCLQAGIVGSARAKCRDLTEARSPLGVLVVLDSFVAGIVLALNHDPPAVDVLLHLGD